MNGEKKITESAMNEIGTADVDGSTHGIRTISNRKRLRNREELNQMKGDTVKRITDMTNEAKTMDDLHKMLHEMAYTLGGMVCHFDKEDRSGMIIELTKAMGMGLMVTAKAIGEPSDIEVVVGHRPE
jgi:hypothetical protein